MLRRVIDMKEIRIQRKWSRLPPERILALGFLLIIIVGAILLSLPMATVSGERLSLIDAVLLPRQCASRDCQ